MPRDKIESHQKILKAAKEEFSIYGYQDASMRRIGERAGLTGAALYRHFKNKEDLFDAVVNPSINAIEEWMERHQQRTYGTLSTQGDLWEDSHIDLMKEVVYPHMDDYTLLLTKAQGTRHETFLHDFVMMTQQAMTEFMSKMNEQGQSIEIPGDQELHLLLSAYVSALFEPVIHQYSYEDALKCLQVVSLFFMPGWQQLFRTH